MAKPHVVLAHPLQNHANYNIFCIYEQDREQLLEQVLEYQKQAMVVVPDVVVSAIIGKGIS